jgi:hypothetical protein
MNTVAECAAAASCRPAGWNRDELHRLLTKYMLVTQQHRGNVA